MPSKNKLLKGIRTAIATIFIILLIMIQLAILFQEYYTIVIKLMVVIIMQSIAYDLLIKSTKNGEFRSVLLYGSASTLIATACIFGFHTAFNGMKEDGISVSVAFWTSVLTAAIMLVMSAFVYRERRKAIRAHKEIWPKYRPVLVAVSFLHVFIGVPCAVVLLKLLKIIDMPISGFRIASLCCLALLFVGISFLTLNSLLHACSFAQRMRIRRFGC